MSLAQNAAAAEVLRFIEVSLGMVDCMSSSRSLGIEILPTLVPLSRVGGGGCVCWCLGGWWLEERGGRVICASRTMEHSSKSGEGD